MEWGFLISEIIVIVIYGFCTHYGEGVHPAADSTLSTGEVDVVTQAVLTKIEAKDRV